MMKFLTTALGGLTVLTVTGLVTPPGQAMFGLRQAQHTAPVSVIADPGSATVAAPLEAPARPAITAPATPAVVPSTAAPAPRPTVTAPVARPVTRPAPAAPPAAAAPAPAANPIGSAGAITNILLNLPQVLQQTQVAPQGGPGPGWVPPGQRAKQDRKHHDGDNNGGEYEH